MQESLICELLPGDRHFCILQYVLNSCDPLEKQTQPEMSGSDFFCAKVSGGNYLEWNGKSFMKMSADQGTVLQLYRERVSLPMHVSSTDLQTSETSQKHIHNFLMTDTISHTKTDCSLLRRVP